MRKILLVCLDNLGDLVFTSALGKSLSLDQELELSIWCKEYSSPIAPLFPGIQRVFAADPFWDKAPGRSKGSIVVFLRTLLAIRRYKFDLVLIPSTCWRTSLFIKLINIPCRVGLAGRKNRRLLTHCVSNPERNKPVVAELLKSFADFLPEPVSPTTYLDQKRMHVQDVPAYQAAKPYVCIHAFAGRMDRCAPREILRSLAQNLQNNGFQVLWLGTADELQGLRREDPTLPKELCADYWAKDLLGIAGLIAKAQFFIGHDSGPLHLAGALGVPVLGFYLPGEPLRTFPQGRAAAVMIARDSAALLTLDAAEAGLKCVLALIKQSFDSNKPLICL